MELENIKSLINDIKEIRNRWNDIVKESKLVAKNIHTATEFSTNRDFSSENDAENNYRVNVFFVIVDAILAGLHRRFSALELI